MSNRLDERFTQLKAKNEKALIAYIMAGDPSLHDTAQLVPALEQAGADIIELGVPFSDPIADGPVIQAAAERALRSGTSLRKILAMVAELRTHTQIPLVLMAYYNTIGAIGEAECCRLAVAAGIDGLIVPDMPLEESGPLAKASRTAGGPHLIFLLAPTSPPSRRKMIAKQGQGFVYYVSLTGITGAKLRDTGDVKRNVQLIQRVSKVPVAVGFGIATPSDVEKMAQFADGVIVGSAIVRKIAECRQASDLPEQVGGFVRTLKAGMLPAI